MKKIIPLILACVLCLTLCGCIATLPGESISTVGREPAATVTTPADTTPMDGTTDTVPEESSPVTVPAVTEPMVPAITEPAATEPPVVHQHTWSAATCTDPKTCEECGEIEGKALGHQWQAATCQQAKTCTLCGATEGKTGSHSWKDATCTDPKTCTTCGKTQGKALGHDYRDGECTLCGVEAPSGETMVWIPTNGGTKYHSRSDCSNMKDPKQVPISEAEALGFAPCKRCH